MPDGLAGRRVKCPGCGQVVYVALQSAGESAPRHGVLVTAKKTERSHLRRAVLPAPLRPRAGRDEDEDEPRTAREAVLRPDPAFRSAVCGLGLLAIGAGVLLLGLCVFGAAADVKPASLVIGAVLGILWVIVGGLAFLKQRWAILTVLIYAYLSCLPFAVLTLLADAIGTANDARISRTIGHPGLFVCLLVVAQAHRAWALSRSSSQPGRRVSFHGLAAVLFLTVLGVESLLLFLGTPPVRRYESFGGVQQKIETPHWEAVGERVNGRWVWSFPRNNVPIFGLPVPRPVFLPLAGACLLVSVLLLAGSLGWRGRRRRAASDVSIAAE